MYNYREAMKSDIIDCLEENYSYLVNPPKKIDFDEAYNIMWVDDSVTGNASGSYTFNSYMASCFLNGNWDLLTEALQDFGFSEDGYSKAIAEGPEWCDVLIRCYLLSDVLLEVLETFIY